MSDVHQQAKNEEKTRKVWQQNRKVVEPCRAMRIYCWCLLLMDNRHCAEDKPPEWSFLTSFQRNVKLLFTLKKIFFLFRPVNAITPPTNCAFSGRRQTEQTAHMHLSSKQFSSHPSHSPSPPPTNHLIRKWVFKLNARPTTHTLDKLRGPRCQIECNSESIFRRSPASLMMT